MFPAHRHPEEGHETATRRHFSAEEKIGIVLDGQRGEDSIAELRRKDGIAQNLYYRWSEEFLEAGKIRLAGDTAREASSDEVKHCCFDPSGNMLCRTGARDLAPAVVPDLS